MPEVIECDDLRLGDEVLLISSGGSLSTTHGTVTEVTPFGSFVLNDDFAFDSDDDYMIVLVAHAEAGDGRTPGFVRYGEGTTVWANFDEKPGGTVRLFMADDKGNFVSPRTLAVYKQSLLRVTEVLWEAP